MAKRTGILKSFRRQIPLPTDPHKRTVCRNFQRVPSENLPTSKESGGVTLRPVSLTNSMHSGGTGELLQPFKQVGLYSSSTIHSAENAIELLRAPQCALLFISKVLEPLVN